MCLLSPMSYWYCGQIKQIPYCTEGHRRVWNMTTFNRHVGKNKRLSNNYLKICDSAEGAGGSAGGSPVTELAVLPGPHKVLAPAIIGVLVEGPVAIHHVAGVDVMAVEMILHWITVIAELHHLALEVGASVDTDAVRALAGLRTHTQ